MKDISVFEGEQITEEEFEKTFEIGISCPFCQQENLTYPVVVIQWLQVCPGCKAKYWVDEKQEFFENLGVCLDEYDAMLICECIAKLEERGSIYRVTIEPYDEWDGLSTEVVFIELPEVPKAEGVTLASVILQS